MIRRTGLTALCLTFTALALLAVTTAPHGARAYEASRSARWESAIRAFEEKDRTSPPMHKGVVFVGSSSIRFWDLGKSFPGMDLINRGFGGSELADSVFFAPRIVLPYEPRTVVLYAGDNDIGFGRSPEQVAADFREFARVVHAKLPKCRIVYLSIKPSPLRWKLVDKGRRANELIAEQCKADDRLVFVDVATPLLGPDGRPRRELFRGDGLHLNEKGYDIWAAVVKPHLR